ncbi:hypothetical protein BASA61_002669 [Batrachochytrium salamandrivorans]|nr:hypothetical protein BASA62_003844 [Batrachochytrium salamandrivorans]KAH6575292.1 hypothetical protein BASA60_005096 [Batrachochytrium salamandrivorans]KAH6599138.1 hypothetical protein BASA61_002669 [Batrachochytrium salamandrivorans]KAH9251633.1 hypothetical protein BASA81_010474 [Batrachochytrium salamandrivorans]KAH9266850.1 hypothetical protein BASA84_000912 [Batrachochytrium salamandrivorans]
MKLKQLESELTKVHKFLDPKIHLEQYPTTPHLAASMVYTAANTYDEIKDAIVLDLGVGCGILTCASAMMGAAVNIGVDIDSDALAQAHNNFDELDIQVDLVQADVQILLDTQLRALGTDHPEASSSGNDHHNGGVQGLLADTVLMNPPFGTKNNKGIDMVFLRVASRIAQKAIYSLHKSSTRDFILKKSREWGLAGKVVAELRYNIDSSYKFHKKKSVDIQVDFWRFEVLRGNE